MTPKNRPWTEDDLRRLTEAVENGVSLIRAATMFKRSVDAVRSKARALGAPFPTIKAAKKTLDAKIKAAERDLL